MNEKEKAAYLQRCIDEYDAEIEAIEADALAGNGAGHRVTDGNATGGAGIIATVLSLAILAIVVPVIVGAWM